MSVRKQPLGPVPEDTVQYAHKCHRKGHPYIAFADAFEDSLEFDDFTEFFSQLGQSAIHPARLALAAMLQAAEGLSDQMAAEKVRDSVLWKYVLRLPMGHSGFDPSVFCEFRKRLLDGNAEELIFNKILHFAEEKGLLDCSKQRTDSTFVLSRARNLGRLELLHETMRNALETLAGAAPDWLLRVLKKEWADRYEKFGFVNWSPAKEKEQIKLSIAIGEDGFYLLDQIDKAAKLPWLTKLHAVVNLRRVWEEQFTHTDDGLSLKQPKDLKPSAQRVATPYDPDARFSSKRTTECNGYKVHITETCDPAKPRLITAVETTVATTNDAVMLPRIHASLQARGLKPNTHLCDAGYANAEVMFRAQEQFGIDVMAPMRGGHSWQSIAGKGFDISQFSIDVEKRVAVCPQGQTSISWKERPHRNTDQISFPRDACASCPTRADCTKSKINPRQLEIQRRNVYEFLQHHRQREQTKEFRTNYSSRAGIEATQSQAVRAFGIRRSPYFGLAKTTFRNLLVGAAINFKRIGEFLCGTPIAQTRTSRFQKLAAVA